MSNTEFTWREAIDTVLSAAPSAMHYKDIADRIIAQGLRTNLGATPAATVNSIIATSISKDGASSPYTRVGAGVFALKSSVKPDVPLATLAQVATAIEAESETEDQYEIISSFGMYWRRESVEWTASPKLLGMQQIGSTPVDFNKQIGIYLLYDGREVIYIGRSTDRPIGKRLYEHTADRLAARWDRFSWFGLLPVSSVGSLGELPKAYDALKIIPALEAILIEALEPRQNRKRGDDLSAVEFIQKEDPSIQKKKLIEAVVSATGP